MDRDLRLHDTLSGRRERFIPVADPVRLYVCGITPYDSTHLGHAFTYVMADVLIRRLSHAGLRVRYVQNLTDIDDAILRAARERGSDWRELGRFWSERYIADMQDLNVLPPARFPLATETIGAMIAAVARLLARGHAYERDGNVYFDIASCAGYGKLSRLTRERMRPKADDSGENLDDPRKRDPLDFLLWRAHEPGEPAWDSPWGAGRPGWHIECSTMAVRELGETIDIHGGGSDLVYPHHEGEIAQAECGSGHAPFVRVWFHTGMVHNEGRKMSKRLGNLVMVRDLLDQHSSDALRLYLLAHHYRGPWEHDRRGLARAQELADKLEAAARGAPVGGAPSAARIPHAGLDDTLLDCEDAFGRALDDDLQTPRAIAALSQLADRVLAARRGDPARSRGAIALRRLADLLGLVLEPGRRHPAVIRGWNEHLRHVEESHAPGTQRASGTDERHGGDSV